MRGWAGNLSSGGWGLYETQNTSASVRGGFRGEFSISRSKNFLSSSRRRSLDWQLKPGQFNCQGTSSFVTNNWKNLPGSTGSPPSGSAGRFSEAIHRCRRLRGSSSARTPAERSRGGAVVPPCPPALRPWGGWVRVRVLARCGWSPASGWEALAAGSRALQGRGHCHRKQGAGCCAWAQCRAPGEARVSD